MATTQKMALLTNRLQVVVVVVAMLARSVVVAETMIVLVVAAVFSCLELLLATHQRLLERGVTE
jgi:hypothetical protein